MESPRTSDAVDPDAASQHGPTTRETSSCSNCIDLSAEVRRLEASLGDERSTFQSFAEHHAATELELNSINSRLSMLVAGVQQLEQEMRAWPAGNIGSLLLLQHDKWADRLSALRIAAAGQQ